jgi:hypothetical protein
VDGGFGDDVCVQAVAQVNRVYVVAVGTSVSNLLVVLRRYSRFSYHSRSLYIIVKKTCRNRLTALSRTASRYNHASPDMFEAPVVAEYTKVRLSRFRKIGCR